MSFSSYHKQNLLANILVDKSSRNQYPQGKHSTIQTEFSTTINIIYDDDRDAQCDRSLRMNPCNSILVNIYNLPMGLLAQKLTSGRNVGISQILEF
ncbi:hypothetical protein [uncultured Nostoc sp.]|uniref:hypothetical protein n=1 Tax=Nostoc sp. TaxID=1180 RepID=UPI0035CBF3D7